VMNWVDPHQDVTHVLQGNWKLLSAVNSEKDNIPSPRQAVGGNFVKDSLVIFGGGPVEGPYDNGAFKYSITESKWVKVKNNTHDYPPPRGVMAIGVVGDNMYMFGGYSERTHLDDFYVLNTTADTWQRLNTTGDVPSPRRGATFVTYNDKLYLYGGSTHRGKEAFSQIYCFDPSTNVWKLVLDTNYRIYRHSAVVYNDRMIIFGGDGQDGLTNRIFSYNFVDNSFKEIVLQSRSNQVIPLPCEAQIAAVYGDYMLTFGGFTSRGPTNYTYAFNLKTRIWQLVIISSFKEMPKPRTFFCMGIKNNTLVVFGGRLDLGDYTSFEYFNDVWSFSFEITTTPL